MKAHKNSPLAIGYVTFNCAANCTMMHVRLFWVKGHDPISGGPGTGLGVGDGGAWVDVVVLGDVEVVLGVVVLVDVVVLGVVVLVVVVLLVVEEVVVGGAVGVVSGCVVVSGIKVVSGTVVSRSISFVGSVVGRFTA